jgi:iron complex transport system substrate-binding protein
MSMRVLRAFASLALVLAACAAPAAAPPPPATTVAAAARYPLSVTDDRGKVVTLTASPRRVVSLAPSATEIVFALGAGDRLVAVDDFSDFPAEAKAIPHIGGFRTSPEKVISSTPDLILAISGGNLPGQLDALNQPLFIFDPSDIEGVYRNITSVGRMLDREPEAQKIVADMRSRIDAVAQKAATAKSRPRVLHEVDSTNPAQLFVAGPNNFIDSMIKIAGGINVAADATVQYPKFSPEQIVARDPEVIVLADAKFGATPEIVRARQGWSAITAVKQNAVYPIDDDLVSRPGPRLVQGFEAYIRLIHPELFR